jgi:chondroitin 4-sulfotransferase 11
MPIDIERNLIFVHIPRTGGTSIERLLGMVDSRRFWSRKPIPALLIPDRTPQHFTWRELTLHLVGDYRKAFKFAFVRNPWDRFASEFRWRQLNYHRSVAAGKVVSELYYNSNDLVTIDAFVRTLELSREKRLSARRGFDAHLEPQLSFVLDDSEAMVMDFVGRYEQFESHVRSVAARFGVKVGLIPHAQSTRREGDYRQLFSAYSRSAVESFYRDDIREFGYVF